MTTQSHKISETFNTTHQLNQSQYANKSEAYLNSQVHATGAEFSLMQRLISEHQPNKVLDLGCGGGHVTYQLAPTLSNFDGQIVAYDLVAEMVQTVTKQAKQKGLGNVTGVVGSAENLPFEAGSFDGMVSRFSAHHWHSVPKALGEVFRVLEAGGRCVIVDILGNENPVLDTLMQATEVIRDPSHVRNYSASEWLHMAGQVGLNLESMTVQSLKLDFASWLARMQTPQNQADTIRQLLIKASNEFQTFYDVQQVETDGKTDIASFTSQVGVMVFGCS